MTEFNAGGSATENPLRTAVTAPPPLAGGLVQVEQQRAVAEVQARMMIARAHPRDQVKCMDLILADCERPSLAEHAVYQYARGGTDIEGPSIRLMEAVARRWGNLASGIKEVNRASGYSECVAYAWDLESGYYDERQFQVRHWRDTKQGGYPVKDERDIYELVANQGQRRKRAVLQAVIPTDVVDAAVAKSERTLKAHADTSETAMARMLEAFAAFGVDRQHIEARIQRRLDAISPAQVVGLKKIYASLRDGMSTPADWFAGAAPAAASDEPVNETAPPRSGADKLKRAVKSRSKRKEEVPPVPAEQASQETPDLVFGMEWALGRLASCSDRETLELLADELRSAASNENERQRISAAYKARLAEIELTGQ